MQSTHAGYRRYKEGGERQGININIVLRESENSGK